MSAGWQNIGQNLSFYGGVGAISEVSAELCWKVQKKETRFMIAASDFASAIPGIKVFFKGRTSATAEAKTEMRCSYAVCWFPVHQEKPAVLLFFRLVADEDVADKSSEGSFAEGKDDFDTVVRKVFVICVCG